MDIDADYQLYNEHLRYRVIRDRTNPLEIYGELEFSRRFRLSKLCFVDLLQEINLCDSDSNRGFPIPPIIQLAVTLRLYACGCFQIVVWMVICSVLVNQLLVKL